MDNAAGAVDLSLDLFGSLDTELAPSDLPEGVSPANVDVAYLPGSVFTRPSRKAVFPAPPSPPIYAKTYVPPTSIPVTIELGEDGMFRTVDDLGNYAAIGSTAAGNRAKSVTAFGREYFAISDGNLGQDIPRQWDGTYFDRVTQDRPGACAAVQSVPLPAVQMTSSGNTLVRNNNQVLCATATAHGLKVGYQAQISGIPDSNSTTVNQTNNANTLLAINDWQLIPGGTPTSHFETINEPVTTALGDMVCSGFGFSIPNTATILGVVVSAALISESTTTSVLSQVSLWQSGALLGTAKTPSTPFTTTYTPESYGSSGDAWGAALIPSVVNDPSFGFSMAVTTDNSRVFIEGPYTIQVYYTLSAASTVGIIKSIVIDNETNPGQALVTTVEPNGMSPGIFASIKGVEPGLISDISGVQWVAGLTTLTTIDDHGLGPGSVIQVVSVLTSTGSTTFTFNGTFTVQSVPSPNQLSYVQVPITSTDPDVINATVGTGSITVSWPIPDNTTTPSYFEVQSCPTPTTFYIAVNYSDGTWSTGTVGFIWEGTFYVSQVVSDTEFYYAQQGPNGSTTAIGTVTPFGQASPGTHQMVVLFQTRQGFITGPSPSVQFIANGGQYLSITGIPIGPSNVTARILAFTGASGGNYFYIPVPASLNGQVTSTATLIQDNSTTSIILDFSDNALFGATAIDIPGNNLFNQVVLGPCLGVFSYADRMIWWGERNKIPNLVNMGFDGGFLATAPTVPLGWSVVTSGGQLVTPPVDAGGAWQITGDGTANQLGCISQSAYQDSYFVAILQPSTQYTFRCWIQSGVTGGSVVAQLVNSTGVLATATINIGSTTEFAQADFSAMTAAQITPDTVLNVYASGLNAGQIVVLDEMELDYTDNLYLTYARMSYVNNPEGIDGVTGIIGPDSDSNPVRTFQKHRDSLCMLTTGPNGSLYETQDSAGSEPSSWDVSEVATLCGATSVWGDSAGEDWFVWASDTGLRAFEGGAVYKISQEVQGLWDEISTPQLTVVVNDPVVRRIYALVTAGSVRQTYVLDYRELNTAAAIDGSGPIKVSFAGRVLSTDVVRKWTTWTGSAVFGGLLILPDGSSQMCFAGANLYKLANDQQGIDDDTGPFQASYTTYAFTGTDNERNLQLGMHRKLFAYAALNVGGIGQVRLVPLPENLANAWAPTPWLPLQAVSMFDVECGLNVLATRCFFRVEGQATITGGPSFWQLNKMVFSVRPDALIPVRGAF
ncbi:hypothetical protein [Granulicella sp. S156]|uniref:hypothetical protein n=1 Tax=Granulicella sp. S156 TaxID=1747224 RepID=UPI00131DA74E|nr:hypothetical protein [Granulicella sp. S156]